ncbi:MAG TPA: ATP-binding protein [Thermodesulfovibrionales bacterium]|nr:ATP-binding protein [Thermodesulfovibrionales bacterium]
MRTKLFLAFFLVIVTALISNLIFERLIMNDFGDYLKGTKEDHLYWVLASVEGSYQDGRWDKGLLSESLHWGMMLGFEIRVEDEGGREITNSHTVMASLPQAMKHRMESITHGSMASGEYERYPLYIGGKETGTLLVRRLSSEGLISVKADVFKERGRSFLIISFVIAGVGAVAVAVFFSLYLSRPVRRLRLAAEGIGKGDFGVRVKPVSGDEIGELSESFNFMAEALQKEELLRKRLTSNIAHELRTPLAVMRAQVEGMMDGIIGNTSEGLENIRSEVERLTRLVEGIENLAKAEASFFSEGEYSRVNLREFLKGIEYAMGPIFREKGLGFSLSERGDIEVIMDVEKLDMIMKNILSNSLKFTASGGVWVDYGREGENFFVEIKDSGKGIPDSEISKIFVRFYRGAGSPDEGIGIGLALVRELIDIMGGRVEVASKIGEGTTFRLWLPIKRQRQKILNA